MSRVMVRYQVKPERAAFQRFQQDVGERCVEPPASVELHEIGSFRFWQ
jgi:hypothetical protein